MVNSSAWARGEADRSPPSLDALRGAQSGHASAATTQAVRTATQRSSASIAQLGREPGITSRKWHKLSTVEDVNTWPKEPALDASKPGRGGDDRRVPAPFAAAAGRLPLCSAAIDPAPDAVSATSVPAAARNLAPSRCRGRQTQAPEVQVLTHRVLPYGHR